MIKEDIRKKVVERFERYVKIETTSDRHSDTFPTTSCQLDLSRMLKDELNSIGVNDVEIDQNGFLIARIPANIKQENLPRGISPGKIPVIGLMAHVDTADAVSGKNVKPILHDNYNGNVIKLKNGHKLDPDEFPQLLNFKGDTIITSDGTTLLGADDKAGIAEIMTAIEYLLSNRDIPQPEIEVVFTPDEETGKGMSRFPLKRMKMKYCYTVDGGAAGSIEIESFNAYRTEITLTGKNIHPGYARGKMINSIRMASKLIELIPQAESPEATDGRFGYYHPIMISGKPEETKVEIYIRDFDDETARRRIETLREACRAVEKAFPGSSAVLRDEKQYSNMYMYIKKEPKIVSYLEEAVKKAGLEPKVEFIRGGTDGSQLSEMGIPTPNIFAGGYNFHSRLEWIPVSSMVKATETLVNLMELWGSKG